jgi:hypothetical protein
VESTLVEVLILGELGEGGFYKVVTRVELEILGEFEEQRGEGA